MRKFPNLMLVLCLLGVAWSPTAHAGGQVNEAACRALVWLHTQQLPDGGFGQRLSNGGYRSSASVTADAVYTLALLGESPAGKRWTVASGRSAVDALAALAPGYVGSDAGQAGKVARAVALAGGDPRSFGGLDLIGIITAAYDSTTGRYHPNYLYRQTLAVEALLRSGVAVPAEARYALLEAQLADGGWFWSFDGQDSDVDTTGRVLMLLSGLAGVQNADAYGRAADYLADIQLADGGWNVGYLPGPANANSTALSVGGVLAAGFDPQAARFGKNGRGALDALLSFQESSGAFVYIQQAGREEVRLMATLDALGALAPLASRRPVSAPAYLPVLLR